MENGNCCTAALRRQMRDLRSKSAVERVVKFPTVVCLCGSTRFIDAFRDANRAETMAGNVVLAPGVFAHAGDPLTEDEKARLDTLHFRKVDIADEVFVLNVGGYIGSSTRNEIDYAERTGKPVRFLEAI